MISNSYHLSKITYPYSNHVLPFYPQVLNYLIVVNINTKRVSFRRNKDIKDISLIEFGKEVCGTGGGHEYAAGGSITNQFMEFTKQLTPYE